MKTDQHTTLFESERPRLTSIAYRMLGRWTEAEDIVQDAFLRWQVADHAALQSPQAWLTTVVTRLSIDRIRRNRASREVYVGPWLPEPVLTPEGGERTDTGIETLASDLSLGLLHVLERLGPEERAAFILREAFDASYADIAATLGKSEQAVRQVISRARTRVREARPRFESRPEVHQRLLTQFMSAVAAGSAEQLTSIFRSDVQLVSDGGGKRPAALRV
jgi:RNA polymerase sigma-70 factor (ECF subfamily)